MQDLPEGLVATYERISQKIARRSRRQKALAERIFNWTACARRPLRFDELKDAVAIDVGDVSWDRTKISAETDGKRFLHVCGNLVVFHERDSTVRLAHHTVGQFLDQNKRDHLWADVRIGELCLTYLGFSDFETQLVSAGRSQDIFGANISRQAGFYRIPQVLGLSNYFYDFILALRNRNNKRCLPDVNYTELMRRYKKKPLPESLTRKYYLLGYIAANWIWHTKNFDPKTQECWSLFEKTVFYKALPFDFKPWDTIEGPSNLPHLAIYLWALENNHLPLLLLLRDLRGHGSLKPYLEYKTLCWDQLTRNAKPHKVDFHRYPDAYDWPAMKIFLERSTRAEILDLCLQEDPSIVSYRHIMSHALKNANLGVIRSLLRGAAHLQKTEIDATNALHSASRDGNQHLVKLLLDLGADPNSRLYQDEYGRTPLCEAAMSDMSGSNGTRGTSIDYSDPCSSLDTIQLLLDRGADPKAKQIGGETILHKALSLGEACVRLLLSSGADVEAKDDRGQSILDLAVEASDRVIDVLVEYGVNLEARDAKTQTALLKAVTKESDDTATVRTLIRHGANVHAKDIAGKTVLHLVRGSRERTLRRFLELGVDVNARDQSGATALGCSVKDDDNAKFKLLLEFGAVFEAESEPPLTDAAARGNKEIVNMLLQMGHDPNRLGNSEMSAISSAVKTQNKEVVMALLEAGADPNLVDKSKVTPLSRAVGNKDKEISRLLIQAGAAIHPPSSFLFSPLCAAITSSDVHMVEFLIEQGADVASFEYRDWRHLRGRQVEMCNFLTSLGVPFKLYNGDDDDDDYMADYLTLASMLP